MVISACEWWAHETCLKRLAWLRELKFSSCFQDGIKLWSKAVSICLPPTLSGHFGSTGLMLAGVIVRLWIFFVFPSPKLSPEAKGLCASKYFNIWKQTDQICSTYQKSFHDGMLSGFESPCLHSEMADTYQWALDRRNKQCNRVNIYSMSVPAVHIVWRKLEHLAWGLPQRHFVEHPGGWYMREIIFGVHLSLPDDPRIHPSCFYQPHSPCQATGQVQMLDSKWLNYLTGFSVGESPMILILNCCQLIFFQLWVKFRYHFLLRYKHILVLSQIRQAQLLLLKLSFPFPLTQRSSWGRILRQGVGSGAWVQDCLHVP